jgi:hypothetical protein
LHVRIDSLRIVRGPEDVIGIDKLVFVDSYHG